MQGMLLAIVTLLVGAAPPGVIAPRTGADLGARGTVVVEGWGAVQPADGRISVDLRLYRRMQVENRIPGVPNVALFDWERPNNRSYVVLSIPGTGYEQRFEAGPWSPFAVPLMPFDGVVDYAGVSGMDLTRTQNVRILELIPPEFMHLFAGDEVTLDWYYDSETSIRGAGITAELDEHMDPGRAATHFDAP